MFDASRVHGAMFLTTRLHGLKKKPGVGEGGAAPICKHNVFMTGSEGAHTGSVFACRMTLEATLLNLGTNLLNWKQNALKMSFEKL